MINPIIKRISTAASRYSNGLKEQRRACADYLSIYYDVRSNPAQIEEINDAYAAAGLPETSALTKKIVLLRLSDLPKQRVQDIHSLLLEAERQDIEPSGMVHWIESSGGVRAILEARPTSTSKKAAKPKAKAPEDGLKSTIADLFYSLEHIQPKPEAITHYETSPCQVSCDQDELLVHVVRRDNGSAYSGWWVKLSADKLEEIALAANGQDELAEAA